jgi:hypothetical protein
MPISGQLHDHLAVRATRDFLLVNYEAIEREVVAIYGIRDGPIVRIRFLR